MTSSTPHPTPDPSGPRKFTVERPGHTFTTYIPSAAVAEIRAEVAEEIARAIEDAIPSTRHFWDTADAARAYALNDAAKLARKHAAAPTESVAAPSVVSTEGSAHPPFRAGDPVPFTPEQLRAAGVEPGSTVTAEMANRVREGSGHPHPSAGPWTGPRPTLTASADRPHDMNCHADERAHWTDCECWCHDAREGDTDAH